MVLSVQNRNSKNFLKLPFVAFLLRYIRFEKSEKNRKKENVKTHPTAAIYVYAFSWQQFGTLSVNFCLVIRLASLCNFNGENRTRTSENINIHDMKRLTIHFLGFSCFPRSASFNNSHSFLSTNNYVVFSLQEICQLVLHDNIFLIFHVRLFECNSSHRRSPPSYVVMATIVCCHADQLYTHTHTKFK